MVLNPTEALKEYNSLHKYEKDCLEDQKVSGSYEQLFSDNRKQVKAIRLFKSVKEENSPELKTIITDETRIYVDFGSLFNDKDYSSMLNTIEAYRDYITLIYIYTGSYSEYDINKIIEKLCDLRVKSYLKFHDWNDDLDLKIRLNNVIKIYSNDLQLIDVSLIYVPTISSIKEWDILIQLITEKNITLNGDIHTDKLECDREWLKNLFSAFTQESSLRVNNQQVDYNLLPWKEVELDHDGFSFDGFEIFKNQKKNYLNYYEVDFKNESLRFENEKIDVLSEQLSRMTNYQQVNTLKINVRKDENNITSLLPVMLEFVTKATNVAQVVTKVDYTTIDLSKFEVGRQILEILKTRDNVFVKQLIESKKKSALNRSKLMFIGGGGAGKTSCVRAFLGEKFVKKHKSTIVADGSRDIVLLDAKDINISQAWKEIPETEGNFYQNDFNTMKRNLLKHEVDAIVAGTGLEAKTDETNTAVKVYNFEENVSKIVRTNKNVKQEVEKNKTDVKQVKKKKRVFLFWRRAKNGMTVDTNTGLVNIKEFEQTATDMKLTLWDFGGQRVFDAAHQFYFTNQGLGIKTIDKELRQLLAEYSSVVVVDNIEKGLCFFPVENSLNARNEKYLLPLRAQIKNVLENPLVGEAIWKKEISIAWLFFMHLVEQQQQNITSLRQLYDFGEEKGFNEDELKEMLDFFTDAGTIVSFKSRFDKLGFSNWMVDDTVIRPKWLIKNLAAFLFNDIHTESVNAIKRLRNMRKWISLHRKGILARSLFDNILWQLGTTPRENVFLAQLCEMMLVMSKVQFKDADNLFEIQERLMENEKHLWLLPSMNEAICEIENINALKFNGESQILKVKWQDAVPKGLFERFTCAFLKHCDGREGLTFESLARNLACVDFRGLSIAIENESRKIFNVILQSKDDVSIAAVKDVLRNVFHDIENLGFAIILKAHLFLIKEPKQTGKQTQKRLILKPPEKKKGKTETLGQKVDWDFDCFMSHSWGEWPSYKTHEQVVGFSKLLKDEGFNVWVDDVELTTTVADAIHRGIDGSSSFIAFITKKYLASANNRNNNAGKEFNYAVKNGVENIIAVLLDKDYLNPNKWKGNVGLHLGNVLYIDFTTEEAIKKNWSTLCERIKDLSTRERPEEEY